jgi:perosamine synthetase
MNAIARIPVAGPSITASEIALVAEAAEHGWYEDAETYPRRFEQAFAAWVGARHAVTLPSCTSALHLALLALGVGPGDEVVVPEITWIATVAPVLQVGATPVFADVDPDTWCLSAASFEALITPRTRAVIPVDLYGGMPDYDPILEIAARRSVSVIEDAAEAVGGSYRGRRAGTLGAAGTFSFHGSKTLTTGEGGMLVTDRDDVHRRVLVLRDHGRSPGDRAFWNREVAYKYKMNAVTAALGLAQLGRVDELVSRKRAILARYRSALADLPGLTFNAEPEGVVNAAWMSTVLLDPALGLSKERFAELLGARGVDTRPFFHPLSSLPAFAGSAAAERGRHMNRVAYARSPYGLNLPSALSLTDAQIDAVAGAVREIVERARAAPPVSARLRPELPLSCR